MKKTTGLTVTRNIHLTAMSVMMVNVAMGNVFFLPLGLMYAHFAAQQHNARRKMLDK